MEFDVVVIGAGAAGMMCAAQAGRRGRRVLLVEHAERIGERIRISGGGRCNFTNLGAGAENFLSQNPHFARSALARYTPRDFIALVERHRIGWHERELGQLFCLESAQDIIDMLKAECDAAGVKWAHPCRVHEVRKSGGEGEEEGDGQGYVLGTEQGRYRCRSLVIATGGLAIPKLGATPFGYKVAEQFGLAIVPPRPALVPLALAPEALERLKGLSGVSFPTLARLGKARFREDALVTHRGLSGPAILQISSYWQMQDYQLNGERQAKLPVALDLLPGTDAAEWLAQHRGSKALLPTLLSERLPRRFAQEWCAMMGLARPLNEFSREDLQKAGEALNGWQIAPSGTLGYAKAEVTLGGVDTAELSSKTMEAKRAPGLYFVGEVVDVTGWLGGYNFQWAWSSGWVAGQFC